MGEAAHDRRDGVNGPAAHQRAQLVAQRLQPQRALEQLRVALGQREHRLVTQEVRGGEHEQVRAVVLQVGAVEQKLAQGLSAVGHFHTEDLFDGAQVGDDVAGRADAADAGGDVGNLLEGAPAHHGLEQARRLHHGHLAGRDLAVLDDEADVAVALDAGDVVDGNLGSGHEATPPLARPQGPRR